MKYENDMSNMVGSDLQVVRSYSFMEKMCIVFLLIKMENNSFIKKKKTFFPCLHSLVTNKAKVWDNSRAGEKPSTASWIFTDLLSNSPKRSPRFSPGCEGTENLFIS